MIRVVSSRKALIAGVAGALAFELSARVLSSGMADVGRILLKKTRFAQTREERSHTQ